MAEPEPAEPALARQRTTAALRGRYQGSVIEQFWNRLNAVQFGDWIILFGAALLLSVLPMIILLSALASTRVDDDISTRLGLSRQGARIVEGLFRTSTFRFNLGVVISLLLAFAGTIAVARSVQVLYERAFQTPHRRNAAAFGRCVIWVMALGGVLIAQATYSRPLRHDPAGTALLPLVSLLAASAFFWWTIHFLLGGERSWRALAPAAAATAVFWVGLGLFAAVFFSSSLVSDAHTYGTIGVVFTLLTWFIAIGAVVTLGAVVGAVWLTRKARRKQEGANAEVSS